MAIAMIGTSFVDIKGYCLEKFIPGGRNAGRLEEVQGGVARNIAEDIVHAGGEALLISLVDSSAASDALVRHLQQENVDTRFMRSVPGGLGTWLAILDSDGDVVASVSRRPQLAEIVRILREEGDEICARSACLCIELDMEEEILREVFRLSDLHGIPVYGLVSNMSIAMERREYLKKLSCFVCNQGEAGLLFGGFADATPEALAEELLRDILKADISRMAVTLGAQGAVYAERCGICGTVPPKKVDVVDTTGAGDAFFAGAALGLSRGRDMAEACRIGTELSAAVICTEANSCPVMRS